jgi:hypothetical protein
MLPQTKGHIAGCSTNYSSTSVCRASVMECACFDVAGLSEGVPRLAGHDSERVGIPFDEEGKRARPARNAAHGRCLCQICRLQGHGVRWVLDSLKR